MSTVTHPLQIFLKRVMPNALEEHNEMVRIGGNNITNRRFLDDTDALAEEEQELVYRHFIDRAYYQLGGGGRVVRWSWANFQCRGVLQFG